MKALLWDGANEIEVSPDFIESGLTLEKAVECYQHGFIYKLVIQQLKKDQPDLDLESTLNKLTLGLGHIYLKLEKLLGEDAACNIVAHVGLMSYLKHE